MSIATIGAAVVIGGVTAGLAATASTPQQLSASDLTQAGIDQLNAELAALPQADRINAAAAAGTSTLKSGYTSRQVSTDQAVQDAQAQVDHFQNLLRATPQQIQDPNAVGTHSGLPGFGSVSVIANPAYQQIQDQLNQAVATLTAAQKAAPGGGSMTQYFDPSGNQVTSDQALESFTGLGQADVQGINAQKTAANILGLEQQYGPQLVQEQLDLMKQANPEGVAARDQEYQDIQKEQATAPDTALSSTLQSQLQGELDAGTTLTPEVQRQVTQAARQAEAARGNLLGNANAYSEAMTAGQAGLNLQNSNQAKALAFLTSGATPTDINYRKNQQDIGNLSSFLSGQTPQAQFGQLSGSGAGPVPYAGGSYTPAQVNPQAAFAQGAQNQLGASAFDLNLFNSTPNPWMSGLSSALNAYGAFNKAATSSPTGTVNNYFGGNP